MKKSVIGIFLFYSFNTIAQNKSVSGIEDGIVPVFQSLSTQVSCDTIFSFPTYDEHPAGITSDGNFIWCQGGSLGYIYKYSFSGLLIDSISNPATQLPGNYGGDLDFDGTNLLVMVEQTDTLFKINPVTGAVVSSFRVAPCTSDCYGVAFDGTYIWISNYISPVIYKLNATTGAVINTFPSSTVLQILPIKFINGRLYGLSLFPGILHEIDTSTGNIVFIDDWCLGYPLGFCKINNQVWGVSSKIFYNGTQRIYQFDSLLATNLPFNVAESASLEIFPIPSMGNITISFPGYIEKGTIAVFNVFGEIVFIESFYNKSLKEINLKNISSGVYFLKVFDEEKYYCKKIIIE